MNKRKHIILVLAAVICGTLLLGSCTGKPTARGYDFESVVKKDYADMVGAYGDAAKMYIACGHLNYAYEEIAEYGISLDSVYFTDMFTLFQVGDSVVEIMHYEGIKTPVVTRKSGRWMECQPITPETDMTAMEALGMFMASGAIGDSVCVPVGNNVVLRLPTCMDSSRYCYLFGYGTVFSVMDEHGNFIRCCE